MPSVRATRTFTPLRRIGAGAGGGRKPTSQTARRPIQSQTLVVSRDRYDIESRRQKQASSFERQFPRLQGGFKKP